MRPVLSESEAKYLDEVTTRSGVCSGEELMHTAGKMTAIWFLENILHPFRCNVLVVSGPGNNGGDGIVAHHYLQEYGIQSMLMLTDQSQRDRPLIREYGIPQNSMVLFHPDFDFSSYDWIIDALFGIGLSRNISGVFQTIIERINETGSIISIDIPSGIFTDTGLTGGISIRARHTLTMGHLKYGHFLNDGKLHSGKINVLDIGFKDLSSDSYQLSCCEKQDVQKWFKNYHPGETKYSRGKSIIISGSKGMTGAAILSAKAAVKIGCGLVKSVVPDSLNSIFESAMAEIITVPLEDHYRGYLSIENFPQIEPHLAWSDVILLGPGLSNENTSTEFMTSILRQPLKKLVLDATGFEPVIQGIIQLSELPYQTVLTPHLGEFSRLFHLKSHKVKHDPISALKSVLPLLEGRILILKGSPTFITTGGQKIVIISNGLPLLATAGTGDVLSGMITGLLAQGYSPLDASIMAAYIHAESSSIFQADMGVRGLIASDIIDMMPKVISKIFNEN